MSANLENSAVATGLEKVSFLNFLMEGRERREEVGTGDGRDMGSREVGEQTLGSPVSQRVEVWIVTSTW